jgi:putative endonuclease
MILAKKLNYNKGKDGEEIARKYLEEKGFELIEANYSNDIGEIDLIMTDKDWLVFVEVKLKIGDKFGTPEEMISRGKLSKIKRVAQVYLMFNPEIKRKFEKYRIDAVCIVKKYDDTIDRIKHYPNLYV